jgi:hypothetical protein
MGGSSHRTDSVDPGESPARVSAVDTAAARTSLRNESTEESAVEIDPHDRFHLRTGEGRE